MPFPTKSYLACVVPSYTPWGKWKNHCGQGHRFLYFKWAHTALALLFPVSVGQALGSLSGLFCNRLFCHSDCISHPSPSSFCSSLTNFLKHTSWFLPQGLCTCYSLCLGWYLFMDCFSTLEYKCYESRVFLFYLFCSLLYPWCPEWFLTYNRSLINIA